MDFWLVLIGFIGIILFLNYYYHWLKNSKGVTPVFIGRLISMCISMVLFALTDISNVPWLLILVGILISVIITILNINTLGIHHGLLTTLWQFFSCALVLIFIMMVVNENNSRVPKTKEKSQS